MYSIVVATDLKNGIGVNNQLPWHLPSDLKHFKALTTGKTIMMGRKTYISIGKALPNRRNIVISRGGFKAEDAEVFFSIEKALDAVAAEPEVMIIGGGMLYDAMLAQTSKIYRTLVHTVVEADVYFPSINPKEWKLIESIENPKDEKNNFSYTFETWEKF